MSTIIAKNNKVSAILLEDLGIEIPGSGQENLTTYFTKVDISEGKDLKSKVSSGDIIINDGINDLSISDGLAHINFKTEYEDPTIDATSMIPHSISDHLDVIGTPSSSDHILKWDTTLGSWAVSIPTTYDSNDTPDTTSSIWIQPEQNELYYYNTIVGDWISSSKITYTYGRSGNLDGAYMGIGGWATGGYYYVPPPGGVITSIYCRANGGNTDKAFQIHIDNVNVFDFSLTTYAYETNEAVIDVPSGSILQVWCSLVGTPINDVVCQLTMHWRFEQT